MKTPYTYWVLPEVSVKEMLQSTVNDLAAHYQTPTFEPHMTLLGDFTEDRELALAKAPEVAKLLHGLQLSFGSVEYSTTYFQNVFVRIKPSVQLMEIYVHARELIGLSGESLFMPHISLLYGNLSMQEREQATQLIAQRQELFTQHAFSAAKLVVTPSTKDPAGWEHLLEVDL